MRQLELRRRPLSVEECEGGEPLVEITGPGHKLDRLNHRSISFAALLRVRAALGETSMHSPEAVDELGDKLFAAVQSVKQGPVYAEEPGVIRVTYPEADLLHTIAYVASHEEIHRRAAEESSSYDIGTGHDSAQRDTRIDPLYTWANIEKELRPPNSTLPPAMDVSYGR